VNIKFLLNFGLFLFFSSLLLAQSDYRITQEFKSRQRSFEIAIEYAKTNDELIKIRKEINEFRNEFKGNKELLNRALYPSNFESSFTTLDKKIEYTHKKLSEISGLQTKVVKLESDYGNISDELEKLSGEVNVLRNTNSRLMTELKAFKSGYGGSRESVDSLKNLVDQLKQGISRRDTLIKEIMDDIFMTAEHKIESLDDAEKIGIQTKIQNTSLIDNIKNLISDNIDFLDASLFTLEDLTVLRSEYSDFDNRWTHFGPKLFDIYAADKQNQDKLFEIDTLISNWSSSINLSVWKSIKDIFNSHNIMLDNFTTGTEFEEVVLSYINSEIITGSEHADVQNDQNYVFFADRAWKDGVKAEWMPLLISNNLLTTDQVSSIEEKLSEWKDSTGGTKSYFIYGIIILLAIIIIISLIVINRKKNRDNANSVGIVDESSEHPIENNQDKLDIDEDEKFIDDKN
jgi:predicted  nucleic acid-binding Zn-ribbon protein